MAKKEVEEAAQPKENTPKYQDGQIIERNGKRFRVEVLNTQVKTKIHPREYLYPGTANHVYTKALTEYMGRIPPEKISSLGGLVLDNEATKNWIGKVIPGDVIGVQNKKYLVEPKAEGTAWDSLTVTEVSPIPNKDNEFPKKSYNTQELDASYIDMAREMGLLDILRRDGKVYGLPEYTDMTYYILNEVEEEQPSQ